ncbi:hypothetical protein OE88DRAFT_28531 [Heliocybe sulcata]|uniref:Uncharacterized protein n=1 Tax=Heliocybe sulcata TaxID=5364 RepID=A0A5C3NI76_9AGAM|nr:hypothetical protein OE88DRAFT_28531 [Heliocybe sulcata]
MSTQVPASALLHTALAIRSPSFKALDILSSRLPPEIRREIHFALLSSVTISLAAASTAALKDYERRLKASLCRDCREYNETIYGADVWKWDGYRGACLCRAQQAVWRRAQRCTPWDLLKNVFVKEAVPTQVSRRVIQQEDVQLFASRDAWLVDHLSRHTLCRGFSSVWEAVDLALRPYGCCVSSDMSKTLEVTSDSIQDSGSDEWAAQCALKRAVDGLMLSEELPFGQSPGVLPIHRRPKRNHNSNLSTLLY